MKRSLLLLALCSSMVAVRAQDTIYFQNGASELVRLIEVNPGTITYRQWNNPQSALYHERRRNIDRIGTQTGGTVWVDEKAWDKYRDSVVKAERDIRRQDPFYTHKKWKYKPDIVSFMPFSVQTNGTGIAISYERLLGKEQNMGVVVPLMYSIYKPGAYIMPGLRIYPFGQRIFTLFTTPSLYAGYGNRKQYGDSIDYYDKTKTYNYIYYVKDFQLGFFINVGFHLNFTQRMGMTMLGGGGVNYLDLANNNGDNAGFAIFQWAFLYRL